MTKGKKAQKNVKSNASKNETNVEYPKEDAIQRPTKADANFTENISKSEILIVTAESCSKEASAKVNDGTEKEILFDDKEQKEKSVVDGGCKREMIVQAQNENEKSVAVNSKQPAQDPLSASVTVQSDIIVQNDDQKKSKQSKKTLDSSIKANVNKKDKVRTKSENEVEQKTKQLLLEENAKSLAQKRSNNPNEESSKEEVNVENNNTRNQEKNLNIMKKEKTPSPKNDVQSDTNKSNSIKKDQRSNEELQTTLNTDTIHKIEADSKSESKKIHDPKNKDSVKVVHIGSEGNKISGIEIKKHVHGSAVSTIFNESQSSDEKFKIICEKYTELYADFSVLQLLAKRQEKEMELNKNEKEILVCEIAKHNLSREKLEHLCRELQKQNKEIREESLKIIREEEGKRKNVAQKFQSTLDEISNQVKESNNKTSKLRDDNLDITVKSRDLLIQLEEKEQELFQYKVRCSEMLQTEKSLRDQISMYTEKYDEFQQTLSRSNELFAGFRSEMETMTTKINNLESDTATWKARWEHSHEAYLEVLNQKTKADTDLLSTSRQLASLVKLCRTLQSERSNLLAKLNGNEASTQPTKEDEANQEKMEETLRQLVSNASEAFKNLSDNPVSTATNEPTATEKSNIPNNKTTNKKAKNKK